VMELDYFGFQNVPSEAIVCNHANFESAKNVAACINAYKEQAREGAAAVTDAQKNLGYIRLAHECFKRFVETGSLGELSYGVDASLADTIIDKTRFNEHLAFCGLQCQSSRRIGPHYFITLTQLED
jgi:hypothetical protein